MYAMNRALIHGAICRSMRRAAYSSKCPEPDMDTGCTYCMPDMSKFPDPKKRFPVMPFHSKQLVINTGTSDWPSKIGTPGTLAGALEPLKRTVINVSAIVPTKPRKQLVLRPFLFPIQGAKHCTEEGFYL